MHQEDIRLLVNMFLCVCLVCKHYSQGALDKQNMELYLGSQVGL